MREVSLETLRNVNIRDPSHDKNLPIMSVSGSINHNAFKKVVFKSPYDGLMPSDRMFSNVLTYSKALEFSNTFRWSSILVLNRLEVSFGSS